MNKFEQPPTPEDKDKSQSPEITKITDLVEVLNELNPDVDINLGDSWGNKIYSSRPVEELNLPEGFYYNDKNGLTNKHNTETGQYIAARIEKLD